MMEVRMKKERRTTFILCIVYLAILTWIIVFKLQFSIFTIGRIRSINLIPFSASADLDEIIDNVIVFIPVGIYLGMLKPEWSFFKKAAPILGLSFAFEAIQFIFILGATDITDLITNTAGGIIGILVCAIASKIFKEKTIKILNTLAIIATVLVIAFLSLILIASSLN